MDIGMLESDHLLDVLSTPQMYSFEVWVETINIDKSKIKENLEGGPSVISSEGAGGMAGRNFRIGYDDYTLPNGLKPFRVRFDLFGIRIVSITQVEYDKLLKFNQNSDSTSIGLQSSKTSSITSLKGKRPSSKKFMKPGQQKQEASFKTDIKVPGLIETTGQKKKLHPNDFVFNLEEVIDLIDEQVFIPINEAVMKKGASATFAMAPIKLIQSLQTGELIITIDRYGGRKTDEGDPQGKGTLSIPQQWKETVLKVANEPNLAPEVLEMGDIVPIKDQSGEEIGTLEYSLSLTCHAGCVVSTAMPSQLGLYVSLGESKNASSLCHTPILAKNINYQSVMRKSMTQDYENFFKPTCTKSVRPTKY